MKTLVINSGSSSIKFQLINPKDEKVFAKGLIEKIGFDDSVFSYFSEGKGKIKKVLPVKDYMTGIRLIKEALMSDEYGVISDMKEIDAVGHRVVHGGEDFSESVLIDEEVIDVLEKNIDLAPLHNPPNLLGIKAAKEELPDVPMVGVFDTAFHQTLPEKAYIYPIPYEYYEKKRVRKFGFHGTSHKYVSMKAAEYLKRSEDELKIITLHLGNGCSIAAIDKGKSVETSLGFGTMCGMPMGTRAGDIDPAIIQYMIEKEKLSCKEIQNILYKKSGMLGISGISSDLREIEEAAENGEKRAKLALEIFSHYGKKFIGAFAAIMGGLDVLVFTAGIGENSKYIREKICKDMEFLGIKIDTNKNDIKGKFKDISTEDSKVKTLIIPTNEELMIAKETLRVVSALLPTNEN
jgi:acetate kinase